MENAVAKATDAADKKKKEAALANHVALPHLGGPDGRRMWAIAMSMGVFRNSKDPDSAMSLLAHLLSPEETLSVMRDSYGQFGTGRRVPRAALRPGDLVFFDGAGHVGIYVGAGRFVHAPHTGTVVRVSRLDGAFGSGYDGARRIR